MNWLLKKIIRPYFENCWFRSNVLDCIGAHFIHSSSDYEGFVFKRLLSISLLIYVMSWFPSREKSKFNIYSVMNLFGQYWVVHYQFDLSSKIVWKIIWVGKNMPFHEPPEGKIGNKWLNKQIQWNICNLTVLSFQLMLLSSFSMQCESLEATLPLQSREMNFLWQKKLKKNVSLFWICFLMVFRFIFDKVRTATKLYLVRFTWLLISAILLLQYFL